MCKNSLLVVLSLVFSLYNDASAQCPQVVWQDEFEKTFLDTSKWSFQNGDGCDIGLCGWGNNELQWYQPENVLISNGQLRIIAKQNVTGEKKYTSSKLKTLGKGDWTYGRFEAMIKMPAGRGLWPAFWMLPSDNVYGGWPRSGEIDIVELIGDKPHEIHGSIHYGKVWPNNANQQASFHLNAGLFNEQFHRFAVEWEEDEIRWLIDDYLYSIIRPDDIAPLTWPFDEKFHLILNLTIGGTWPGNPDENTSFPQSMDIEYVRVYDGFFPSISGNHQIDKNATAETYTIHNTSQNATFDWDIPANAELIRGQGTNEITLNWGETGGNITVTIQDDCNTKEITLHVEAKEPEVKAPIIKVGTIENFDVSSNQMIQTFSTGKYTNSVNNPGPSSINQSEFVGKYRRNMDNRYDVMICKISDLHLEDFVTGTHKFFIDIYTDAPIGTEILFQAENSNIATGANYPAGRHSRFTAFTTQQNAWERLELEFQNQPDNSINAKDVNQYIFLFAPNSNSADSYYFDNFNIYTVQTVNPQGK